MGLLFRPKLETVMTEGDCRLVERKDFSVKRIVALDISVLVRILVKLNRSD